MRRLLIAAAWLTLAAPAWAASVSITGAFARATPPGADTGVVYLTLQSDTDDRLTGAASPVAAGAMLHQTTMAGMAGMVMSMDMLTAIDLPAGKKIVLAPDHLHIMLQGLKHRLVKGETIPLHLTFAKAPPADISVPIGSFAATVPGG